MDSFRSLRPLVGVGVLAAVAATGAASSSLPAATELPAALQHRHDPVKNKHHRDDGLYSSTNWSGYSVTGANGSISEAQGSWVVPAVSCSTGSQYSSFWVGIDGFNSNSVEQTGTDSDCSGGTPVYYAWYEFYPHPSFLISRMAVHVGDTMTAKVSFSGKTFTVTLIDQTRGTSFSTSSRMNAARSSAEWIAEAPSSSGGVLSIANFGTVSFTGSQATMHGALRTVGGFLEPSATVATSNVVQEITMGQSNGAGAQPSALFGSTLDSFNDSYIAGSSSTKQSGKK
jgi:hypothetical protein